MIEVGNWTTDLIDIKKIENPYLKIKMLMEVFLSTFSSEEAFLFRYSPIDHLAEGIVSATKHEYKQISSIRDDIETFPAIYKAVAEQCPKYYEGNDFHFNLSRKYIISGEVNSLLVVPLVFKQVVVGYFCSTKFSSPFYSKKLEEAKTFSSTAGEILVNQNKFIKNDDIKLSKREFEVMKYISEGYSSKQITTVLNLSEPTIKQYVKSVMDKTNTSNRTHAISYLYRNGILK